MHLVLYTDGAARGNPGPAAIGTVLVDLDGKEIDATGRVIGTATNNEAEYQALLYGLKRARAHHAKRLEIRTDSELLAQQLRGKYKVRAPNLKSLYTEAIGTLQKFESVIVTHIPRELNRRADALANQALDEQVDTEGDGVRHA